MTAAANFIEAASAGIPADSYRGNAMFEQPFELSRSSKDHGIGLGLPICHMIVVAHGGALTAENDAGGGALFSLTLTRSDHPG